MRSNGNSQDSKQCLKDVKPEDRTRAYQQRFHHLDVILGAGAV